MNGAELLVATLKAKGVKQVFSLNGGHISDIYKECIDYGIKILDVRHEEGAAQMAYSYARLTGKPAVVLVTAGPGVTNTVTGVATSFVNATPMVILAGHCPTPQLGMGAMQEMDQVGIMRPITKLANTVRDARRIEMWVSQAFKVATAGKPGPVFLDFPTDILRHQVDPAIADNTDTSSTYIPPTPDKSAIKKAVEMLKQAQRPVLIAGGGAFFGGAAAPLVQLAEHLQLPVLTTPLNRGVFPGDHGLHVAGARSVALGKSDLVILLGARLNFVLAYGQEPRFAADSKFIQVDTDGTEIGRNRNVDLGIIADSRMFIESLLSATADTDFSGRYQEWVDLLQQRDQKKRTELEQKASVSSTPIHPLRLCKEVRDAATDDTVIVLDGGDILSFGRLIVTRNQPGTYVDPGPLGTIGMGVSMAVGAGVAKPESKVIALIGDGSLGMTFMEMDTAIRHNIPIVVVVSNNGGWNIERQAMIMDFGSEYTVGTTLNHTRYDQMVAAMGGHGELVTDPEDIQPAIQRALKSEGVACVNVITSGEVISPDLSRGLAGVPLEQAVNYKKISD